MTQSAITSAIAAVSSFDVEVVTDLPVSDISTTTIYFVGPATGTNTYDEYRKSFQYTEQNQLNQ